MASEFGFMAGSAPLQRGTAALASSGIQSEDPGRENMRSIPETFSAPAANGKRRAATAARVALALVACLLAACAGGGVRNTSRTFKTVVIDAGHGGHDNGTRASRRIVEKDAALDVAQRLN